MSDDSLPLHQTCIVGMSSSGKTTFALRHLRYTPCACRFIYDDLGVAGRKLGVRPVSTATELEAALATRWVVYNPLRMFPDDLDADGKPGAGFKFFCQWVLEACKRGPGKKLVMVDEIWRWCTGQNIPRHLAMLSQIGRIENVELVTATQRPNLINESITGQTTELVAFRTDAPLALAKIADLSDGKLSPDKIRTLPLGKFISLNRLSGVTLAGSVF